MLSTLTVNTNADDTTDDAVLTLREAILLVNAGGDANMALGRMLSVGEAAQIDNTNPFGTDDTILFDATAVNAANVITLGGTELSITSGLTITGNGSDSTYISANYASRLFNISGATFNVTFDGVTLQNGYIDSMSANGGGIASYAGGGRSRSRTAFSAGIGRSAAETSGGDCMPRISM